MYDELAISSSCSQCTYRYRQVSLDNLNNNNNDDDENLSLRQVQELFFPPNDFCVDLLMLIPNVHQRYDILIKCKSKNVNHACVVKFY